MANPPDLIERYRRAPVVFRCLMILKLLTFIHKTFTMLRRCHYLYAISIFLSNVLSFLPVASQTSPSPPVRIAVVGITHGHAGFILGRKPKPDTELVGIYEPNTDLAKRYAKSFNI